MPNRPDTGYHQGSQKCPRRACCRQPTPLYSWLQLATSRFLAHPFCLPARERQLQFAEIVIMDAL